MDKPDICVRCNNLASIECSGCNSALYCSETCLSSDTTNHDLICTSFASPTSGPATEGTSVLGFLFPPDQSNPQVVRVPISGFSDPDSGISFQEAETETHFGTSAVPQRLSSERNRVRNRETKSMLEIWHAASDLQNKCIREIGGGGGDGKGPFFDWKGPVLVLAMTRPTGFMVDPGAYRDVQPADFGDAVDFLLDYGDGSHGRLLRETLDTLGAARPGLEVPEGEHAGERVEESRIVVEME